MTEPPDFRPHNPKQLQAVMTKTAEIPTTPLSPAARTLATPCAPLSAEDRRRYERELDAGARRQLTELQSAARRTAGTFAARAAATREPGAQAAARAIEGLCRAVADALAMAGRVPATTKEETK